MKKRLFLECASAALAASLWPQLGLAQSTSMLAPGAPSSEPVDAWAGLGATFTLAAAWRSVAGVSSDFVGLLQLDWLAGQVKVASAVQVPSRAHGLLVEPGGGFVAVASRPGDWLLRCDATGAVQQWHRLEGESGGRTLDGHGCASADGEWLYTAETHTRSGQGWVSVRDRRSFRKVAEWRTHGVEPHQLLLDPQGGLMIANGGILRSEGDKKRDLHLMDSSLVRLNPVTGERLGQWRLKDARLGMRHLAWNQPQPVAGASAPQQTLLGIALQNEHDDPVQRRSSPLLAVWDGQQLLLPTSVPAGGGYAGDIVAGPDGGFVLSSQHTHTAVHWSPQAPAELTAVANLQQAGALASWGTSGQPQGVLLGAGRGVGRWHPTLVPGFLTWPEGMAIDNHWVVVPTVSRSAALA